MKNELRYLNHHECEIITKLRTERINLNDYMFFINQNNTNECKYCNKKKKDKKGKIIEMKIKVIEKVSHYLIDCPGIKDEMILSLSKNAVNYNIERNKLRKKLRKIDIYFKNPRNFTSQNILFPHIWQRRVYYNNNKIIKHKNLNNRVEILKAVVNFVRATKRFKTDKGY